MKSLPVKAFSWPPTSETNSENSPLGWLLGALEHQVFEEMGDARLARRIVGRAVAIPDHMGDDRRAMVGNDDDVEAVGEGEMRDLGGAEDMKTTSGSDRNWRASRDWPQDGRNHDG